MTRRDHFNFLPNSINHHKYHHYLIMQSTFELVRTVLPTRQALEVAVSLEGCGAEYASDLCGLHIPAHYATDLDNVAPAAVNRLERLFNLWGAVLVR